MKVPLIFVVAGLLGMAAFGRAEVPCEISVPRSVEAHNPILSLSDLLDADACPGWLGAAAQVHLGALPLAGSVRVFEGREVRVLLEEVARTEGFTAAAILAVPRRISVRRAGSRSSCAEIAQALFPDPSGELDEVECGAAGRIPGDASFAVTRKSWDSAAGAWDVVVRCTRPGDCVPFLLRLPGKGVAGIAAKAGRTEDPGRTPLSPRLRSQASPLPAPGPVLVRRGEKVTLVWDQDGIRLVIPAVCLEDGHQGETVRARIAGRMVHAVVVRAGTLRAQS